MFKKKAGVQFSIQRSIDIISETALWKNILVIFARSFNVINNF